MDWTTDKIRTLEKYWQTKTDRELADMIGTTINGIRCKASKLHLNNGEYRKFGKIIKYGPGPQTIKESIGRKQTNDLQNIKNSMPLDKKIKLQQYISQRVGYQPKRGRVVGITDYFIILQTRNYKECFRLDEFLTKAVILDA